MTIVRSDARRYIRQITSSQWDAVPISFLVALLVCMFYNAYRYPLQINSSGTSQVYSDTPLPFTLGKYALFTLLTLLSFSSAALTVRTPLVFSASQGLLLYATFYVVLITVGHTVQSGTLSSFQIVAPVLCVMPLVALARTWMFAPAAAGRLARLCLLIALAILVIHSISNAMQFMLYEITGRLPALGYRGSLVRYGGLWDDPNSTATYSALVLIFLASGRVHLSRRLALFLTGCGIFNLLLAWSYSAWIVLVVGLVTLAVVRLYRGGLLAAIFVAGLGIGAAGFVMATPDLSGLPVVGRVLDLKHEGSIEARLDAVRSGYYTSELPRTPWEWAFGRDDPQSTETAPVSWLSAVGLIGLGLMMLWFTSSLRRIAQTPERIWLLPVAAAIILGSLLTPYLVIFPLGSLFFMTVGMTSAYYEGLAVQKPNKARSPLEVTHGQSEASTN